MTEWPAWVAAGGSLSLLLGTWKCRLLATAITHLGDGKRQRSSSVPGHCKMDEPACDTLELGQDDRAWAFMASWRL